MNSKQEMLIAIALSALLLVVICWTLVNTVKSGAMFVASFPQGGSGERLFGSAAILFLLSGDETARLIAKSTSIRSQLQCWAIWLLLLGCAFVLRSWVLGARSAVVFSIAICALAIYSLSAIFRPRHSLG